MIVFHMYFAYTGWAKKNRTCLSVDNSAMVNRRKACDMSKFLECCRQKGRTCIANRLNTLCLICINLHYPWN